MRRRRWKSGLAIEVKFKGSRSWVLATARSRWQTFGIEKKSVVASTSLKIRWRISTGKLESETIGLWKSLLFLSEFFAFWLHWAEKMKRSAKWQSWKKKKTKTKQMSHDDDEPFDCLKRRTNRRCHSPLSDPDEHNAILYRERSWPMWWSHDRLADRKSIDRSSHFSAKLLDRSLFVLFLSSLPSSPIEEMDPYKNGTIWNRGSQGTNKQRRHAAQAALPS